MTRSDVYFFSVILIGMSLVVVSVFNYQIWFDFWWLLLLPVAIIKLYFYDSKLWKWFDKPIRKTKT